MVDGLEEFDPDCDDLQLNTSSIFKADHVDTFDSDCDKASITSTIFMARLSHAGSVNGDDVGPYYDTYHENYFPNHVVQKTEYSEHLVFNNDSYDKPTSDNNIISYADYMITIENDAAKSVPPPEQDNAMILSIIKKMLSQVERRNTINPKAKSVNESFTSELEQYKKMSKF
ncbi:hypothetical protein Tco_1202554 [Tanacetum coccineum]